MRTDIIELLRCPGAHESNPLVTVAVRRDGDRLIDAMLGCSVCGAEYVVRDGVAWLRRDRADVEHVEQDSYADAMRTAALLGLREPGSRVILAGVQGRAAVAIEDATGARCIVVNALVAAEDDPRIDQLVIDDRRAIPLASASLAGLAVDGATIGLLADAARVVRRGGRVVAPVHAPVPEGCRELARDDCEWVAEVEGGASLPIKLTRAT